MSRLWRVLSWFFPNGKFPESWIPPTCIGKKDADENSAFLCVIFASKQHKSPISQNNKQLFRKMRA
jgi:hypothetical protein